MKTAVVLAVAVATGSCGRPGGPTETSNEFGDAAVVFINGIKCPTAVSAEPLPARVEVTMPELGGAGDSNTYLTEALFGRFKTICGECHVNGSSGGFVVSESTFASLVTQSVIDNRIESNDTTMVMPPYGIPYNQRSPNDPVVQLVGLLEKWITQGSPSRSFRLDSAGSSDGGDGGPTGNGGGAGPAAPSFSLTPDLGARLTNIGSCIPSKYVIGLDTQTMDGLDAYFAQSTELPDTLDKTDLTTFDSDTVARDGVISYFPAYPLWSDAAGKMRHVRVPRGQSIVFDKSTQKFQIPPNTRFYKTFFKSVIDIAGNPTWKRIETRLIVSRPDQTLPDGTVEQTALFGTYVWNEDETQAVLLDDPLRSGQPFADRVITYVTDEPKAQAITATTSADDLQTALESAGAVRHYGLPGSSRCVQCHMGSPSAAFVLGFTPLQVASLPPGQSGVIEPATADEMTQLQRLIDYGVISGMTSPSDVLPLERTQLPRMPRNDYELRAQAYMIGNCSHCHNPRGFPSTKAPELKNVLNFLPGPDGGIFQFPLDRTSPVRARGLNQDVPIPYITPSLRDYPTAPSNTYTLKYQVCSGDVGTDGWCTVPGQAIDFIDAPWRSLIYRNVDTPYDYVDDVAIFPHMPMNTPGYDCRVPQIMADWMVSIPARRINSGVNEDAVGDASDRSPQPYVEVLPGDSGYAAAQTAAQKRMAVYHAGHRYNFCPDTTDIIDPGVNTLVASALTPADDRIYDLTATPPRLITIAEGVPDRPHWVVTDISDPPGDWIPRQPDWEKALVHQQVVTLGDTQALQTVVNTLPGVNLTDGIRRTLTTEVPFGLWLPKPGCDLSRVPTAGGYQGDDRPLWMDVSNADPTAPVYLESPGAAVFTNICINCHGPQADAKGLLADEITLMTGGGARVANFRAGLFGPADSPGANRQRVFGPVIPSPSTATADDFGARYLAWMALGGTQKTIPNSLLSIVSTTPVLGVSRHHLTTGASPNMLQLAQKLCANTLLADDDDLKTLEHFFDHGTVDWSNQTALIGSSGDAELWLRVCALGNRPVVRVIVPVNVSWATNTPASLAEIHPAQSLYWGAGDGTGTPYPADAPVLDHRGHVVNGGSIVPGPGQVLPDNLFPTCLQQPSAPDQAAFAEAFRQNNPVFGQGGTQSLIPYCPSSLFATVPASDGSGQQVPKWKLAVDPSKSGIDQYPDAKVWSIRGAINAGLAVFLYVDQLSKGLVTPKPRYDQCDQLVP